MPRDPRIDTVIGIFTPRFITSGVPLADFQDATDGVEKWEDWCPSWSARALVHEELGNEAMNSGNSKSAAEHWTTASLIYHFGKFMAVEFPDQMREAHQKAISCRTMALPHLAPPGERIEIPFEGKFLAGNLRIPDGETHCGLVILIPGLEATKEEIFGYEPNFLERGLATIAIDGPGQGEAEYDFPIRPNYETVAGSVIDWAEGRADIDSDRIGIFGVSMGGHYAPRAAAMEKRIKACVSISGAYSWGENWDEKSYINREVFRIRSHCASMEEAKEYSKILTLEGVAEKITCPIYIVAGGRDRLTAVESAERIAAEVSGPKVLSIVEDGNHVCHNRPYKVRPQTADWMASRLNARG